MFEIHQAGQVVRLPHAPGVRVSVDPGLPERIDTVLHAHGCCHCSGPAKLLAHGGKAPDALIHNDSAAPSRPSPENPPNPKSSARASIAIECGLSNVDLGLVLGDGSKKTVAGTGWFEIESRRYSVRWVFERLKGFGRRAHSTDYSAVWHPISNDPTTFPTHSPDEPENNAIPHRSNHTPPRPASSPGHVNPRGCGGQTTLARDPGGNSTPMKMIVTGGLNDSCEIGKQPKPRKGWHARCQQVRRRPEDRRRGLENPGRRWGERQAGVGKSTGLR